MSLLSYRTTLLHWCNLIPAELLLGSKLRTNLLQIQELLKSSWPYLETFREQNDEFKIKQKQYYD